MAKTRVLKTLASMRKLILIWRTFFRNIELKKRMKIHIGFGEYCSEESSFIMEV
jgi:hypothetical protein